MVKRERPQEGEPPKEGDQGREQPGRSCGERHVAGGGKLVALENDEKQKQKKKRLGGGITEVTGRITNPPPPGPGRLLLYYKNHCRTASLLDDKER